MSSRLTLAIPVMNQLQDSKGILGSLRAMTSDDVEWLIIDNGSTDPYSEFFRKYLRPKRLNFIANHENIGMVKTMQQIYENCETELLAILHNDVFIYEKDWDKRIVNIFEKDATIGMAGFFGCQGVGPEGGRMQDSPSADVAPGWSNMLEAEIHGMRMRKEIQPVSIFDGMAMIFRMEMLRKSNGFDQSYKYHHYYDRDASLESLRHGYRNVAVNVFCHHLSGLTANRGEYQDWVNKKTEEIDRSGRSGDKWTHDENMEIFMKKWEGILPLYVEDDFSFRGTVGLSQPGDLFYKGDKIVGHI